MQRITRQLHQFRMDGFRFWFAALLSLTALLATVGSVKAQGRGMLRQNERRRKNFRQGMS